ncbi:MAG: hypothetical protein PHT23_02925, partial [Bacteroidales bacterium]|nr:hypothetical protein [Bacteroidales bacterium]
MNKFRFFSNILLIVAVVLAVTACKNTSDSNKLTVNYEKYVMPNGLQVVLHTDHSDPVRSYAIMYHVGSSTEVPG